MVYSSNIEVVEQTTSKEPKVNFYKLCLKKIKSCEVWPSRINLIIHMNIDRIGGGRGRINSRRKERSK